MNTSTLMTYYYHAGTRIGDTESASFRWSSHTRRSRRAAEREARAMARAKGGTPIVEYWDRGHGLRPGDAEAVAGCVEVCDAAD